MKRMDDVHNTHGWGSAPRAPSPPNLPRLAMALAGLLGGWAVAYGFGRLLWLIAGEAGWVLVVRTMVLVACVTVGGLLMIRRYDLRHRF